MTYFLATCCFYCLYCGYNVVRIDTTVREGVKDDGFLSFPMLSHIINMREINVLLIFVFFFLGNVKIHRTQKSIRMKQVSPVKKFSPNKGKIIRLKSDEILARGSESESVHNRLGAARTMSKLANRIGKVSLSPPQNSRKVNKKTGGGTSVFDRLGGGNRSF